MKVRENQEILFGKVMMRKSYDKEFVITFISSFRLLVVDCHPLYHVEFYETYHPAVLIPNSTNVNLTLISIQFTFYLLLIFIIRERERKSKQQAKLRLKLIYIGGNGHNSV